MEEWKVIEGYERFSISNKGNVWGVKGLMKSRNNSRGYKIIGVRKKGEKKQKMFLIHRLVAIYFVDNPDNKPQVNHIDGDKDNNNASNLEWVTQSENQNHAYKTGLQKILPEQVERMKYYAKKKRKPIRVVNDKTGLDKEFESVISASEYIGYNEKSLINWLKGHHESRDGYKAFYVEEGGD